MSSATPEKTQPVVPNAQTLAVTALERVVSGVRAASFWIAALLPLVVIGAVATGSVEQNFDAFAGLIALNLFCAVVGHAHQPDA